MKYLLLKGCAGLGNRLMTLSNAMEYCKRNNRTLIVDWSDGLYGIKGENVFNKYFQIVDLDYADMTDEDLFSNKSFYPKLWETLDPHMALYDKYTYGLPSINKKIKNRFIPNKGRFRNIRGFFYYQGKPYKEIVKTTFMPFVFSLFNNKDITLGGFLKDNLKQDIVIFADYQPLYFPTNITNHLVLRPHMQNEIDSFASKYKLDNSIGVHIRATDRMVDNAIDKIKLQLNRIIEQNKTLSVFLATDNVAIENEFNRMGLQIIKYPKFIPEIDNNEGGIHHWASKNNKEEMAEVILKESIIDIWLLSKCKYLLYMGNSSFSKIAVTLHNAKSINWLD